MILINRLTKKAEICSMSYAARIIGITYKTIGEWSKGNGEEVEKMYGVYKETSIYELYFDPETVKQEKGYRIRKNKGGFKKK